ncbi:MAG: GNAT family N-acetyltransferase [Bacteriovoracaceae bacterium]
MQFHHFTPSDLPKLKQMMQDFYLSEHISFHPEEASRCLLELAAKKNLGEIFLLEDENETIGYVILCYTYSLEFHGIYGFLDEIYLKENFRGLGIGSLVMEELVLHAKKRGCTHLRLEVETENSQAIHFYTKRGFHSHARYLMTRKI